MKSKKSFSRRAFLAGTAATSALALSPKSLKSDESIFSSRTRYRPSLGIVKLNGNENPYGPSQKALAAIDEASKHSGYYVNSSGEKLRSMIAEKHGLTTDHIVLSSGSTAVLMNVALASLKKGHILAPDLFWDSTANLASDVSQNKLKRLPSNIKHEINLKVMRDSIAKNISLVHITNPNNPTGSVLNNLELKEFCRETSNYCTVLIDEAYNDLTDKPNSSTMIPLIKEGKNIIVTRTFSKIHGLAGLRIGYMIAKPEIISEVMKFGFIGNWTTNKAGVAAAIASYNDEIFLSHSKSMINEGKEMVMEAIKKNGLSALPSKANFIFVNLDSLNADQFKKSMAKRNIIISGIFRNHKNWSRVSMGKIDDLQKYINALPEVLEEIS